MTLLHNEVNRDYNPVWVETEGAKLKRLRAKYGRFAGLVAKVAASRHWVGEGVGYWQAVDARRGRYDCGKSVIAYML